MTTDEDKEESRKLRLLEILCEMWDSEKLISLMDAEYQRGRDDYRDELLIQMDARREEAFKKFDPKPKASNAEPANRSTAKATANVGDDRESMERPSEKVASPEAAAPIKQETEIREAAKVGIDPNAAAAITRIERPKPPEGRKDVGGQINPGRPATLETNIELATMAIAALGGKASGSQIQSWVRINKWTDVPKYWNSSLYDLAHAGKLARDGINFTLPRRVSEAAPDLSQAPQPAPEKKPPPSPSPPSHVLSREPVSVMMPTVQPTAGPRPAPKLQGIKFEHKDLSTMLTSRQYSLAGKLRMAIGKGHLSEAFLAQQVMGSNTEGNRSVVKSECLSMNEALASVRLKIEHYPGYGLIMKDLP